MKPIPNTSLWNKNLLKWLPHWFFPLPLGPALKKAGNMDKLSYHTHKLLHDFLSKEIIQDNIVY